MPPKRPSPLSDEQAWNVLQQCIDLVGEATGETSFASDTLDMTRRLLVSMQMALIYQMDGLHTSTKERSNLEPVTVYLIPEIKEAIREYALEHHPRSDIAEVLAFIIGRQMALLGYFKPNQD